jgi:glycopeptide antibiotics resistance protein
LPLYRNYGIILNIIIKIKQGRDEWWLVMKKRIFSILFFMYMAFLILFVVLKFDGSFEALISLRCSIMENEQNGIINVNLIPFRSISPYLRNITEPFAFRNIAGNIVLFLPLGFFFCNIFSKKILKSIILCIAVILVIECIQFVFKIGFFDVDDVLLNFVGCLFGICVGLVLNAVDTSIK